MQLNKRLFAVVFTMIIILSGVIVSAFEMTVSANPANKPTPTPTPKPTPTLTPTPTSLPAEQVIFSHSDYVSVSKSAQILFVGVSGSSNTALKFTISYIVSSVQSPSMWRVAGSIAKSGVATNTQVVATASAADINVFHTVTFVGSAAIIELYGDSGVGGSIFYSVTVEAPAGTTVNVIYGP